MTNLISILFILIEIFSSVHAKVGGGGGRRSFNDFKLGSLIGRFSSDGVAVKGLNAFWQCVHWKNSRQSLNRNSKFIIFHKPFHGFGDGFACRQAAANSWQQEYLFFTHLFTGFAKFFSCRPEAGILGSNDILCSHATLFRGILRSFFAN